MAMPPDLFLVRHGQSEGNLFNSRSRAGDHSDFTDEFAARHSSKWRLTSKGRDQAILTGNWIKNNLGYLMPFGRMYTSEYIRAMETAALLDLPEAHWMREYYLRERDYGLMDVLPEDVRQEKFAESIRRLKIDSFFTSPPDGESMAALSLRIDRVLDTLHRECSHKPTIVVCHGQVMWAFRMRLERLSQERYAELDLSENPFDRLHNCQILHYTRIKHGYEELYYEKLRHPLSRAIQVHEDFLEPYFHSVRSICPWDPSLSRNEWEPIERCTYTNEELMQTVNQYPIIIKE